MFGRFVLLLILLLCLNAGYVWVFFTIATQTEYVTATRHLFAAEQCPATYVYHLDQLHAYNNDTGYGNLLVKYLHLYDTEQHELGKIIFSHAFHSPCIVHDPAKASVFLVPVLFPPERAPTTEEIENGGTKIATYSKGASEVLNAVCPTLPDMHLPYKGKGPHVFISDTYFTLEGFCAGHAQYTERFGSSFLWVSNTVSNSGLSFAYPSSIHVNHKLTPPPWTRHDQRKFLMTFGASMEGSEQNKLLRKAIAAQCRDEVDCAFVDLGQYAETKVLEAFEFKFRSTFCIEPGGYGPERKSTMDSVLLGCIPVIVSDAFVSERIWEANWWWYRNASVVVKERDLLSPKFRLRDHLSAIPLSKIKQIRAVIASHVSTVHWGRLESTAFQTFLSAVHRADVWKQ